MKKIFFAFILLTMSSLTSAGWWYNGIRVSNVCRASFNMNWYYVYPVYSAQPLGSFCRFPDGTPGVVTEN